MQFSNVLLLMWLVVFGASQDTDKVEKVSNQSPNKEKLGLFNKVKEEKDRLHSFSVVEQKAPRNITEDRNSPLLVFTPEEKVPAQNTTKGEESSSHALAPEGKFAPQTPTIDKKSVFHNFAPEEQGASPNPKDEKSSFHAFDPKEKDLPQNPTNDETSAFRAFAPEVKGAPQNTTKGEESAFHPEEKGAPQNPIKEEKNVPQNPNQDSVINSFVHNQTKEGEDDVPDLSKAGIGVQNSTKGNNPCPFTIVDCLCEADTKREHIIHVNLKTAAIVDQKTGISKCFAEEDPLVSCQNHKCVIIPNRNFEILFQRGKKAHPSNYLDNTKTVDSPTANTTNNSSREGAGPIASNAFLSPFYPVEFTYPRAAGEGGHSRVARSVYGSGMCRVPTLANSEVTCWKWPNWQTCKQNCIYGHGLDNGGKTIKEKSFTCRNTENKWKPHPIRDCDPYMNCKVHLKSPGDLNCVEPTDGPAYCDINCADYDDYHSHGKVRWKCEEKAMLHGKGKNHLPHCAEFEDADVKLGAPDY